MKSPRRNGLRSAGFALALATLASSSLALAEPAAPAGRAFLALELPKHGAYVGQSIPVTIRAYYRAGTNVTLTGAPAVTDPELTLQATDLVQTHAVVNGVGYLVVTWKDHLSSVKAGRFIVAAQVPSTLEWQDAVAMPKPASPESSDDPGMPDLFGNDPFGGVTSLQQMQQQMRRQMKQLMDQFAVPDFGPVQHREVVLRSPAVTLDVQPLPALGRPPGFTGAVGHFTMSSSATPTQVRVGEPITLTLQVKGDGNVGRVDVAGLAGSTDWKTYAPTATEGHGDKTFSQPVVPLHDGTITIPPVSFAYFDPDTSTYVTSSSAPIAVDVAPGQGAIASSKGDVPAAPSGPALAPNVDSIGHAVASLAPSLSQRWFWAAQALPLTVLGGALLAVLRHRRRLRYPERLRRRKARRGVSDQIAVMDRALATGNAVAFFAAARSAIQHSLGARWGIAPAAISLAEIESRLAGDEVQRLRPVFDADAARFSGAAAGDADLAPWKQMVERELSHLEGQVTP